VVCLATGAGLLLIVLRLLDHADRDEERPDSVAALDHGDIDTLA
jgi:hypothetical protein